MNQHAVHSVAPPRSSLEQTTHATRTWQLNKAPDATYAQLEQIFSDTLKKNRQGRTLMMCPKEAHFAHSFYYLPEDDDVPDMDIVPNRLPFESIWVVTTFKGLAICAYVERMAVIGVRPDYLYYPVAIPGTRIRTTAEELDERAAFVVDKALKRLLTSHFEEVDSEVRANINRGRSCHKNNKLPLLPPFIRITDTPAKKFGEQGPQQGGTHASPLGHERRGHWRTYRASGKMVWVNEMKINGGSEAARSYRVEA